MSYVSSVHKQDWTERRPGKAFGSDIARDLRPASPDARPQPRRVVTPADFDDFPAAPVERGAPAGFYDWYDWVVVWRYWNRDARGLRRLYLLEAGELLRLGADMSALELSLLVGVTERTVMRWQSILKPVGLRDLRGDGSAA